MEYEYKRKSENEVGIRESEYAKREEQFFERLITVEEVAVVLGLAPQTIRNWVAMRRFPHIRIGGKTRFRPRSVEAWISQKERESCR